MLKDLKQKRKTQLEEIGQASEPEWDGRNVGIIRPGFFFKNDDLYAKGFNGISGKCERTDG